MADKRSFVKRVRTALRSQRVFPNRERATFTQEGLHRDKSHRDQMRDAEIKISHEAPASKIAQPDQHKSHEDEQHDQHVRDQNQISQP